MGVVVMPRKESGLKDLLAIGQLFDVYNRYKGRKTRESLAQQQLGLQPMQQREGQRAVDVAQKVAGLTGRPATLRMQLAEDFSKYGQEMEEQSTERLPAFKKKSEKEFVKGLGAIKKAEDIAMEGARKESIELSPNPVYIKGENWMEKTRNQYETVQKKLVNCKTNSERIKLLRRARNNQTILDQTGPTKGKTRASTARELYDRQINSILLSSQAGRGRGKGRKAELWYNSRTKAISTQRPPTTARGTVKDKAWRPMSKEQFGTEQKRLETRLKNAENRGDFETANAIQDQLHAREGITTRAEKLAEGDRYVREYAKKLAKRKAVLKRNKLVTLKRPY